MSTFKGDIYNLIEDLKFKKEDQTDIENSIYEVYWLQINKRVRIDIEINHKLLDQDDVLFKVVIGISEVVIKPNSKKNVEKFISFF